MTLIVACVILLFLYILYTKLPTEGFEEQKLDEYGKDYEDVRWQRTVDNDPWTAAFKQHGYGVVMSKGAPTPLKPSHLREYGEIQYDPKARENNLLVNDALVLDQIKKTRQMIGAEFHGASKMPDEFKRLYQADFIRAEETSTRFDNNALDNYMVNR